MNRRVFPLQKLKLLICVLCLEMLSYFECRKSFLPRRIGEGVEVEDPRLFPFFAQLRLPIYTNSSIFEQCGASLIHPQWILTAGHCFPNDTKEIDWLTQQNREMVIMGSNEVYSNLSSKNSIIEVHRHPLFLWLSRDIGDYVENDIAVAKLTNSYKLTPTVQTIKLVASFTKCKGTVIGIGGTNIDNPKNKSTNVKYAEAEVIKPGKDTGLRNTTFLTLAEIGDGKYHPTSGYALHGDSGGPFVCVIDSVPVQIGVLSLGGKAENNIAFNIFERVDLYVKFIFQHVPDAQLLRKKVKTVSCQKQIPVNTFLLLVLLYLLLVIK